MADIQPEFQVEKVSGNFTQNITFIEEKHTTRMIAGVERISTTRKLVTKVHNFTEGYEIYYPQGHMLFVAADDEDQLIHLGVLQDPRRVDMESGEIVPEDYAPSIKENVMNKVRAKHRGPTQGGIAAALEG